MWQYNHWTLVIWNMRYRSLLWNVAQLQLTTTGNEPDKPTCSWLRKYGRIHKQITGSLKWLWFPCFPPSDVQNVTQPLQLKHVLLTIITVCFCHKSENSLKSCCITLFQQFKISFINLSLQLCSHVGWTKKAHKAVQLHFSLRQFHSTSCSFLAT